MSIIPIISPQGRKRSSLSLHPYLPLHLEWGSLLSLKIPWFWHRLLPSGHQKEAQSGTGSQQYPNSLTLCPAHSLRAKGIKTIDHLQTVLIFPSRKTVRTVLPYISWVPCAYALSFYLKTHQLCLPAMSWKLYLKFSICHSVVCPFSLIVPSHLLHLCRTCFTLSESSPENFKVLCGSSGSNKHWFLYMLRNKQEKQR